MMVVKELLIISKPQGSKQDVIIKYDVINLTVVILLMRIQSLNFLQF